MKKIRYADLPPRLQEQIDRQLGDRAASTALKPPAPSRSPRPRMTMTEQAYEAELVARYGRDHVHFEGLTLRLRNGHRYTPDFVVFLDRGDLALIEVKGGYRLGSYQRARLAFDQARLDWPMFFFRWMEKRDGVFVEAEPTSEIHRPGKPGRSTKTDLNADGRSGFATEAGGESGNAASEVAHA